MASISSQIAGLSQEERTSLEKKLKEKGFYINEKNEIVELVKSNTIELVEIQEDYELSSAQKRLWITNQIEKDNIAYNIPAFIYLSGSLNEKAIKEAYKYVLNRHESLRTIFIVKSGVPRQKVLEDLASSLEIVDLRDKNNTDDIVLQYVEDNIRSPFLLDKGPLIRCSLLRIEDNKYLMSFNMHHIIADGWSSAIFIRDFVTAYNSFKKEQNPGLPKLPVQYKDYSAWNNKLLKSSKLLEQKRYWHGKLSGEIPTLNLETDRKRLPYQTFNGKSYKFSLSKQLTIQLKSFSITNNLSLFIVLQGFFKILLYKYTGQEDIIIGSPTAGRFHEDLKDQIGMYVNNLVLRDFINGNMRVLDFFNSVKETCTEAFDNQDYPFEKLVEEIVKKRDLSRSPLFDVMLNLQNNKGTDVCFDGLEVLPYKSENGISKYDLTYEFDEKDDILNCSIEFNTDLFDEVRIIKMATHFNNLVSNVLSNPELKVKDYEIINDLEKNQLLNVFNNTYSGYIDNKSIIDYFEEQVEKNPYNTALMYKDSSINYIELNQKANKLANYLIRNTVSKSVVALCIEPSVEMIIGILAILKSGNTYLGLETSLPQKRIELILDDANVNNIITSHGFSELFRDLGLQCVIIDKELKYFEKEVELNPIREEINQDLYIIYTSGSTGHPKGVIGKNKGMVNRLCWGWKVFPYNDNDICCQKTSISFVDHISEIFSPLLAGIPLVIMSETERKDALLLIDEVINRNVTRIVLVPSLLKLILNLPIEKIMALSKLTYVFSSGETLPSDLIVKFYNKFPEAKLINIYGSSEVSADVIYSSTGKSNHEKLLEYFDDEPENSCCNLNESKKITLPNSSVADVAKIFTNFNLSDNPLSLEKYYELLKRDVLPYKINTGAPTFVGHMTSQIPNFMHDLSKLISEMNQNLVKVETSKSLLFLERETIAVMHKLFYNFSDQFYKENIQLVGSNLGIVTAGGSFANITALLTARNNKVLKCLDTNKNLKKSLYKALQDNGYNDMVILGSDLMHYSIKKAASFIGLGTDNILTVKSGNNGKIILDELEKTILKCEKEKVLIIAIIGIAGATETGSIDPLLQIGDIAKKYDIHFHVDAAWGGATIFSEKNKYKLSGIEKADSITLCGHKQLFLPQGVSMCLFKNPETLNLIETKARYQAIEGTFDPGRFTIDGSRSAISLTWNASLKVLGKSGYEFLINNGIEKTQIFSSIIDKHEAFELIGEPELNILNYRYLPKAFRNKLNKRNISLNDVEIINDINVKIQESQFLKGETFVSRTTLSHTKYNHNIVVFRVVLSNPKTEVKDLFEVLRDQLVIANEIDDVNLNNEINALETLSITYDYEDNNCKSIRGSIIGKPISNTSAYILNKDLKLLPIGVTGELYIGGDNLSSGYLNKEKLTEEKFIENSYNKGNKLYRTGDLAYWLPDGKLVYMGRADQQVKIRGHRIELGEVGKVFAKYEGIKSAVVAVKEKDGEDYIVGYYTSDFEIKLDDLKLYLGNYLPSYMLPSFYIEMNDIPLTQSGKVDYASLPAINKEFLLTKEFVPPSNEVEEKIVDIWKEVLKLDCISVIDNFFDIGGTSLNGVVIVSEMYKIDLEVSLYQIFKYPTVKELSLVIMDNKNSSGKLNNNSFWLNQNFQQYKKLPIINAKSVNNISQSTLELSQRETVHFTDISNNIFFTNYNSVVISALFKAFSDWTGYNNFIFNYTDSEDLKLTLPIIIKKDNDLDKSETNYRELKILSIRDQLKEFLSYKNEYFNIDDKLINKIETECIFLGKVSDNDTSSMFNELMSNSKKISIFVYILGGALKVTIFSNYYTQNLIEELKYNLSIELKKTCDIYSNKDINSLVLMDNRYAKCLNVKPVQNSFFCYEDVFLSIVESMEFEYRLMYMDSWSLYYDKTMESETIGPRIKSSFNELSQLELYHGITFETYEKEDKSNWLDLIKHQIDKNIPVLVSLDMFYAPWDIRYYEKSHSLHMIAISGYYKDKFYCTDSSVFKFGIELTKEVLIKGLHQYSLMNIENSNYSIEPTSLLKKILDNYTEKETSKNIKSLADDIYNGLDIEKEIEMSDDPDLMFNPIHINLCNIFSRSRKNLCKVFEYVCGYLNDDFYSSIESLLMEIASDSKEVTVIMLKAVHGVVVKDIRETIYKILNNIVAMEDQLYEKVLNYISENDNHKGICTNNRKIINNLKTGNNQLKFKNFSYIPLDDYYCNNGIGTYIDDSCSSNICGMGQYIYMQENSQKEIMTNGRINFEFPVVQSDLEDNILCRSQEIKVNKEGFSHIAFLGCSDWGSFSKSIEVLYEDGSRQRILLEMKMWDAWKNNPDEIFWKGVSADKFAGSTRKGNHAICLQSRIYKLHSNNRIKSLILPNCEPIHIFSITLCS